MPTELTETEKRINNLWLKWTEHVHTPLASLILWSELRDTARLMTLRNIDLAVLQQVQMNLPHIDDSNGALESLITLAVHMNTYEGGLACLDLFIGRENWVQRLTEKREEFKTRWEKRWEHMPGFCSITPEEYASGAVIPDNPFSSAPSNETVPSIRAFEP